jgi:hypothetical protein
MSHPDLLLGWLLESTDTWRQGIGISTSAHLPTLVTIPDRAVTFVLYQSSLLPILRWIALTCAGPLWVVNASIEMDMVWYESGELASANLSLNHYGDLRNAKHN